MSSFAPRYPVGQHHSGNFLIALEGHVPNNINIKRSFVNGTIEAKFDLNKGIVYVSPTPAHPH